MLTIFLSMISALALSMLLAMTPLHLSFLILMFALSSTFWFSLYTSTWFALTLFMVYIGGMLVMFAYFVAISPNYNISTMPLMVCFITTFIFSMWFLTTMMNSPSTSFSMENTHLIMSIQFSPLQGPILIFMILILLLALIFVVKIANRNSGPMRPFLM